MQIRELFKKQIDRDIKGVIKIGQEDDVNVRQELDEYVVTRELRSHIDKFFSAFGKSLDGDTDKMGVWISGFFGSGKSHFLKILSYILDNKEVDGIPPVQYFSEKLDDAMLLAEMQRAGRVSHDVILFNIDSKAEADAKSSKEAIVRVFNRVFNEYLGYSGSIPWLADLERKLDREGKYVAFKDRFQALQGQSWEDARGDFYFIEDEFVQALSETSGMTDEAARKWYHKSEETYSLSIDRFATDVREYILSKGKNHHVVFLVDEIGQYIGDDSGLMLNLQTITEDLGTRCGGKAWIIVTSQQDIDSVVKVKGNDFSKITGRFNTRLSLSAANVDEVIKKRLLTKNENGGVVDTLRLTYMQKEAIIKNLLVFSANTPAMKTFKSPEEFVEIYPFLPYQFNLLQDVFEAVRKHGASGKHLSHGERSLLSAFQESAVHFMDQEVGFLMPFHAFYHSIESFLDHDVRIVVERAKGNSKLINFDVDVLCLLFMIKYLGEKFPSNLENITTLMVDHIETDKLELTRKVEESLKRLREQALIQRNGDAYFFLTNAEQDINSEIKNTNVDFSDVNKKIAELIFEAILNAENKYAYNSEQVFTFNRKLDNDFYGPQRGEIALHVVTPYNTDGEDENRLKMLTAQENSVLFRLPEGVSYYEEMEETLKIETYLRRGNKAQTPEGEVIKSRKAEEISERRDRAESALKESLSRAVIYAYGQKQDIREKAFLTRVNDAFNILVTNKYSKIDMMKPFVYSKGDLVKVLQERLQVIMDDAMSNKLAFDEIARHVEDMSRMNMPLTVKTLTEKYSREPYHWRSEDVKGLLLRMFNHQIISLINGAEGLDRSEIEKVVDLIWKDANTDTIKIKKKIVPPAATVEKARKAAESIFTRAGLANDVDTLIKDIRRIIDDEIKNDDAVPERRGINDLLREYDKNPSYPCKKVLEDTKASLLQLTAVTDELQFLNAVIQAEEELKELYDQLAILRKFFEHQVKFFNEAQKQITIFEKNRTYVTDEAAIGLVDQMKAILAMPAPFSSIPKLPELREKFIDIFTDLLSHECDAIRPAITANEQTVKMYLESATLPKEIQEKLLSKSYERFKKLMDELDRANTFVDAIFKKDEANKAKEQLIQEIDKAVEVNKPKKPEPVPGDPPVVVPIPKKVKKLSLTNLAHGFTDIESKEDIDRTVQAFRAYLEKEMGENTVIKLI